MRYFAHTAELQDGKPDPDLRHWQPLSTHLRKVATLAAQFAAPLGLAAEAELAGLLHELGSIATYSRLTRAGSVPSAWKPARHLWRSLGAGAEPAARNGVLASSGFLRLAWDRGRSATRQSGSCPVLALPVLIRLGFFSQYGFRHGIRLGLRRCRGCGQAGPMSQSFLVFGFIRRWIGRRLQGFVPSLTRPPVLGRDDQRPVLEDHGGFVTNPASVQQYLRQEQPEAIANLLNIAG